VEFNVKVAGTHKSGFGRLFNVPIEISFRLSIFAKLKALVLVDWLPDKEVVGSNISNSSNPSTTERLSEGKRDPESPNLTNFHLTIRRSNRYVRDVPLTNYLNCISKFHILF